MKVNEILDKLLIIPKKIKLKDFIFKQDENSLIETNATEGDISYLLNLAGFKKKAVVKEYSGIKNTYILNIGNKDFNNIETDFENDEEYILDIEKTSVLICSKSFQGMLLGLKTFIRMKEELNELPGMYIRDYPDIPVRAVHTCMFRPDDGTDKEISTPSYIKRMMKTAALSGYNYIIIEFWGMFPYSLSYAHWPEAYSKEEVCDLISFALDKLYITPIPQQNLCSHAGWSRIISRQHTVLDQNPSMADMYIPGGWCFATENPKTKEFLKLLMDELIETFRNPPYFHCGFDKAFGFGSTEEDRTMSADVLFAKHISFLNSYLSERNIRMIMWADMLYSSMDALYFKCSPEIVDTIPKNVLINIWTHNNPGRKWQDAEFFEDKGFETVYSPFINDKSIESMVYVCNKRKSHGMVQTTWHKPQTAAFYVILSGALQWCQKRPDKKIIDNFKEKWYREDK